LDLKLTVDGLEKERDFYFSKLRDIELICWSGSSGPGLLIIPCHIWDLGLPLAVEIRAILSHYV